MLLLLCLLNVLQVLFRVKPEIRPEAGWLWAAPHAAERGQGLGEPLTSSGLELHSPTTTGSAGSAGMLGEKMPWLFQRGTTYRTQLCWALATVYQTLLGIMQHPEGEQRENKPTGSADTPSLRQALRLLQLWLQALRILQPHNWCCS